MARWTSLVLGMALAAAAAPSVRAAEPGEAGGVDPVARCMRANLPAQSRIREAAFVSRDHLGSERRVEALVTWKRFEDGLYRVLLRVRAPEDLRDSAVLLIERAEGTDLFLYVPELRKTRRITSQSLRGSLFGSDFTYEDFQRLQGMAAQGERERLPDSEIEGVPVHVLVQHKGPDEASAYERVVSYVDAATCVPLRVEMWEPGERLRKVMTIDPGSVLEQDGARIPRRVLLEDRRQGSTTRLELDGVDLAVKVPRRELGLSALER